MLPLFAFVGKYKYAELGVTMIQDILTLPPEILTLWEMNWGVGWCGSRLAHDETNEFVNGAVKRSCGSRSSPEFITRYTTLHPWACRLTNNLRSQLNYYPAESTSTVDMWPTIVHLCAEIEKLGTFCPPPDNDSTEVSNKTFFHPYFKQKLDPSRLEVEKIGTELVQKRVRATVLRSSKETYTLPLPPLFLFSDQPGIVKLGKRKSSDIELDGQPIKKMKKKELKRHLQLRGLSTTGEKAQLYFELRGNLLEYLSSGTEGDSTTTTDAVAVQELPT